jgi:pyrroline-5-carboxylate reductase
MPTRNLNLVVIGGGNMGSALVDAAVRGRSSGADIVRVAEPDQAKRERLHKEHAGSVAVYVTASEAVSAGGTSARVVLAVKPQLFAIVASEMAGARVLRDQLVISIMAGVRTSAVHQALGGGKDPGIRVRVTRAMPNLGLSVGEAMTCVCGGPGAVEEDVAATEALFELGGRVVRAEEDLFDAFTAVASSGLAYVFYLAQSMVDGAVALGFERGVAAQAVRQTIVGAGALLRELPSEPGALVAAVKSKGGTTEAAMDVLTSRGFADVVARALAAARDRGQELGRGG